MSKIIQAIRLPGLRLDSLGNYLAALGLMKVCTRKWPDLHCLWYGDVFVVGATHLTNDALCDFLLKEWKPTKYERWWKGAKEIAKLRSWEPDLGRVRILDAHIVSKGESNVYNDILGTGGNVAKRDFSKVFEVCIGLTRHRSSSIWLQHSIFGDAGEAPIALPNLPSTGTWFSNANKAFNSGYSVARDGQLSPWSYLLALEGALLLRGGAARRLGERALKYATFPFISDAAAPGTAGETDVERSEFWAPVWEKPASLADVNALLLRGQARIGNRAARAPFDFSAAAFTAQVQAGLARFERFSLRQTTSANTYEAVAAGTAAIGAPSAHSLNRAIVRIANWADSIPSDKSLFVGLRAPVERALLDLAQEPRQPQNYRKLLTAIGQVQRRIDLNKNWRTSKPISKLPVALFKHAWPDELSAEIEVARAIASLGPDVYGLRHNIFGLERVPSPRSESFKDPRPASTVWHDGDPVRLLADVLERRLIDSNPEIGVPLRGRQFCSRLALESFVRGEIDMNIVAGLLPSFSLITWLRTEREDAQLTVTAASPELLLQAFFRPLITSSIVRLQKNADEIEPDALRARSLVKMIRGEMWPQAIALAARVYHSCGLEILEPDANVPVSGDWVAACLLIPIELKLVRETFQRWIIRTKKG
jgi:CRISPR-associated protein Csx17